VVLLRLPWKGGFASVLSVDPRRISEASSEHNYSTPCECVKTVIWKEVRESMMTYLPT
jgi:hypothetical protein